jgi:hypothetical protein
MREALGTRTWLCCLGGLDDCDNPSSKDYHNIFEGSIGQNALLFDCSAIGQQLDQQLSIAARLDNNPGPSSMS